MIELWIYEQGRTHQRLCGSLDRALADARAALERGKPVQIVPDPFSHDEAETP